MAAEADWTLLHAHTHLHPPALPLGQQDRQPTQEGKPDKT